MADAIKPLGGKAYGSIGHLPQSRLGPGDWHVHEGQARICLEKPRRGDRVVVTEKLDGACMAVAKLDGVLVPLTRAGYRAHDGAYPHLRAFGPFVHANHDRFDLLLDEGERVVGEWIAMAHGTKYDPDHEGCAPFVAFDIFRGGKRILTDEFEARVALAHVPYRAKIHDGVGGCPIETAMNRLGPYGWHGAIDPVEGAVWRVEREGRVDFLAKYVRLDKRDGSYLSSITGRPELWNFPSLGPTNGAGAA